jgi:8-oxo-dGTP diphosphatase
MPLTIVYAQTTFPTTVQKTLFLAGPTERTGRPTAWRQEALKILNDLSYDGHVFIPEAEGYVWNDKCDEQNAWEHDALSRADAIVFWVDRNLTIRPGFTTNIEWGQWMQSKKVVLGIPVGAPKTSYMEWCAKKYGVPCFPRLEPALRIAVGCIIGPGALREGDSAQISILDWHAKRCAPIQYPKPDLTADCVVVHEGDVLLIRRKKDPYKGQWALPGGYINKGEKSKDAAARELLEETGLVAEDLRYVGVYDAPNRDPRGWVVSHAYTCIDTTSRDILAGDDAAEAKWFSMAEAEAMPLAFDHNQILTDALDSLDSVK